MPLADFKGPANHTGIFKHLIGETIKACFVDNLGHVWIVVPSGHAIMFAGFDASANAFSHEEPARVAQEIDKRRSEINEKLTQLRDLAPGLDLG